MMMMMIMMIIMMIMIMAMIMTMIMMSMIMTNMMVTLVWEGHVTVCCWVASMELMMIMMVMKMIVTWVKEVPGKIHNKGTSEALTDHDRNPILTQDG